MATTKLKHYTLGKVIKICSPWNHKQPQFQTVKSCSMQFFWGSQGVFLEGRCVCLLTVTGPSYLDAVFNLDVWIFLKVFVSVHSWWDFKICYLLTVKQLFNSKHEGFFLSPGTFAIATLCISLLVALRKHCVNNANECLYKYMLLLFIIQSLFVKDARSVSLYPYNQ